MHSDESSSGCLSPWPVWLLAYAEMVCSIGGLENLIRPCASAFTLWIGTQGVVSLHEKQKRKTLRFLHLRRKSRSVTNVMMGQSPTGFSKSPTLCILSRGATQSSITQKAILSRLE